MKPVLNALIFLFSITIFSQSITDSLLITNREWINKDLDYLRFDKDTLIYNISNKKHKLYYDFGKKTLTLKEIYKIGGTDIKEEKIKLKIKSLTKNKLVIYPLDDKINLDQEIHYKLDYSPFFKKKEFVFYNREEQTNYVDYKKITFHGSTCFGTCPSFSLEINRGGKVYYQGRIYTKEFTGNFEGLLEREEHIGLHEILNRSKLYAMSQKWKQKSKLIDAPRYSYIIELRNGETIEINTNNQHPILDKLSNYLVNIPQKLKLEKSKAKHNFNKPSVNALDIIANVEEEE